MAGVFDNAPDDVRYCWIAVRGIKAADLLVELGLQATGECDGVPDLGIGELADGWTALVDIDPGAAFRPPWSRIVEHATAIAVSEDSRALRTEARGYAGGRETWRVVVDAAAPDVLSFSGEPPDEYGPLIDSMGWDVFEETPPEEVAETFYDVPLLLGLVGCGLRLGAEPEGFRWTQLRRA
jgi:hypothetical protein